MTATATKLLVTNTYDGSTFSCSTSYPCPVKEFDATPPAAYPGLLTSSVTAAKTTTVQYYGYGAVLSATGSDGSSVTSALTSGTNYAAPASITTQSYSNALSYNSWLGTTQNTGLNGEQTSMTYDTSGRPLTATSAYGGVVNYSYPYTVVTPTWQATTGPNGYAITTLDGLGRPMTAQSGPNSWTIQSETDTVYAPCSCSPLGKIQKTSQPYAPGATVAWTTYTYDGIGRPVSIQAPDGASTTTYAYSGNLTTVTDPAGNWKKLTNDVEGNLTTVVEPDPLGGYGATQTTSYTYDWMNHLATSTMTRGTVTQTRTFVYDDAGRLTSAANPENGTVTYSYGSDNTLTDKHDAKGQDIVYSYDSQKRITMVQMYPTGIGGSEDLCQRVTYSYGTSTAAYNLGRLIATAYGYAGAVCIPGGLPTSYFENYTYNVNGGVASKNFVMQRIWTDSMSVPHTVWGSVGAWYSYDPWGRVIQFTYPGFDPFDPVPPVPGYVVFWSGFDGMGRPSWTMDAAANTWAQSAYYDAAGRMTSLQYPGVSSTSLTLATKTMTYNANGQLAAQSQDHSAGGVQYIYPAGNNGQISQAVDTIQGKPISYQYDALKRLTSASSVPISGTTPAGLRHSSTMDLGI